MLPTALNKTELYNIIIFIPVVSISSGYIYNKINYFNLSRSHACIYEYTFASLLVLRQTVEDELVERVRCRMNTVREVQKATVMAKAQTCERTNQLTAQNSRSGKSITSSNAICKLRKTHNR